jgi:hypothetical protein
MNENTSGWQPHKLQPGCVNTNDGPHNVQSPMEQCNTDATCRIHVSGYEKRLPWNRNGRVHMNEAPHLQHPR